MAPRFPSPPGGLPEDLAEPVTPPSSRHVTIIGIADRPPVAPPSVDPEQISGSDAVVSLAASGRNDRHSPAPAPPRRRTPWLIGVIAVLALSVSFLVQATRSVPTASFSADRLASVTIPGTAPSIPWPPTGESAMSIPATLGRSSRRGPRRPRAHRQPHQGHDGVHRAARSPPLPPMHKGLPSSHDG